MPILEFLGELVRKTGHNKMIREGNYKSIEQEYKENVARINENWMVLPESISESREGKTVVKTANGYFNKFMLWLGISTASIIVTAIIVLLVYCSVLKFCKKRPTVRFQEVQEMLPLPTQSHMSSTNSINSFTKSILKYTRKN